MDSVSICNMALMMVGLPAITSFDENSNSARLCRSFFPALRDRCLRDHCWSFAETTAALQQLNEQSHDPEYPFVCALPGDVIRVVRLMENTPFRCNGKRIFTTVFPARVVYCRRVEDPELFDVTFTEALQYLLAAEIGLANTRSVQLISLFRGEYRQRLAMARSIDTAENRAAYQNAPRRSRWIADRGGAAESRNDPSGPIKWTTGTEGRQGE